AVARAAAARGTAIGLSSFASKPVEDVVAANPQTFFQIYWAGPRDQLLQRIERARAAGVTGLILTLDWSFAHSRDWGSPSIPERLDLNTMARHAPEALARPRWLPAFARTGRLPSLTVPNMAAPGGPAPAFSGAYGEWMQTPPPAWEEVRWLREQWDGPFMLKGITRIDDARRAADAGVTAISVSNHGGNNLDGTPAAIRARAVMIGRAYLWGLAANGQAGVENVLDILRAGLDSALLALGRASVHDLVIPAGFTRALGTSAPDIKVT